MRFLQAETTQQVAGTLKKAGGLQCRSPLLQYRWSQYPYSYCRECFKAMDGTGPYWRAEPRGPGLASADACQSGLPAQGRNRQRRVNGVSSPGSSLQAIICSPGGSQPWENASARTCESTLGSEHHGSSTGLQQRRPSDGAQCARMDGRMAAVGSLWDWIGARPGERTRERTTAHCLRTVHRPWSKAHGGA
jgi:hypothetical protein